MPEYTQDADSSDARYNGETGSIRQRCAALGIRWLEESLLWNERMIALFGDEEIGGFRFSGERNEELIANAKSFFDGAVPEVRSKTVVPPFVVLKSTPPVPPKYAVVELVA